MRLKLDENLGEHHAQRLRAAGHDVETVRSQAMSGAEDRVLYQVCLAEGRGLVTLDLDFADPFRFDPISGAGIAVLRVPAQPGREELDAAVERLVVALEHGELVGHLWIVDRLRVREYRDPALGPE